jgi:hypothetical protein
VSAFFNSVRPYSGRLVKPDAKLLVTYTDGIGDGEGLLTRRRSNGGW